MAASLTKLLTGGDTITARMLYQNPIEIEPTWKIFLITNHLPEIDEDTVAMWRRLRVVRFTVQFPEGSRDEKLIDKLRAEASGVLAWMVQGCLAWQRDGLTAPPEVMQETAQYRQEQDVFGRFLEECTDEDLGSEVVARELHGQYQNWCRREGVSPIPIGAFGRKLKDRGYSKARRGHAKVNVWCGLRLTTEPTTGQIKDAVEDDMVPTRYRRLLRP